MVWGPIIAGGVALASAALSSRKKKAKKRSTMDKNQQKLWKEYHDAIHGQGPLADLYNYDAQKAQQNFQQYYGEPAYQSFQENVVPQVTGQFRSKNLQNSTYAGQALSRAGRDVQNDINRNMANYMYEMEQSVLNRKANAVNSALNTQTFAYEKPQEQWFDALLNGAGGAFGKAGGKYAANYLFGG